LRLGRTVAVKRLRADLASDAIFQARFRREAQSAAALNHPAIVAVYDTGEEHAADGSNLLIPYIVMERVEGKTLREILHEGRKILPERALEITADVLAALDYSHRAGIIHRDIKPANVMLTPTGDVKVMDFGIARAVADSSSTMTQTAAVVGTAQYLSPEQARGEQVDTRSDIYSTGCLLYELLTGRPPFVGDSPVAVAYQHVREEAPPPSSIDPEISPDLDAICAKSLAKSTQDRYQSAADMRADIERALAGQQVDAPAVAGAAAMTAATSQYAGMGSDTAETSAVPAEEEQRGRRWWWLWLLLALALLLALLGAIFLPRLLGGEAPPQTTVPTVTGLTLEEAEQRINSADLEVGDLTRKPDDQVPAGQVLTQTPPPGEVRNQGSQVDLEISSGRKKVEIPDLVGSQLAEARAELERLELDVAVDRANSGVRRNQVLSTDPRAGDRVREGSLVTVVVSRGLKEVPALVGLPRDDAIAALEARRIDWQTRPDPTAVRPAGIVSGQDPAAGTSVDSNDVVTLFVSTREEETTTPTPTEEETTPTPTEEETTPTPTEEETSESPAFPPPSSPDEGD
ncbi:MAG: Stk1 family PASTA domain-containing Ser/Thr kinase, partial [Nocardioidaceae bacterium]